MNERFVIFLENGGERDDLWGFSVWIRHNVLSFKQMKGLEVFQTIDPYQDEFTEFLRDKSVKEVVE